MKKSIATVLILMATTSVALSQTYCSMEAQSAIHKNSHNELIGVFINHGFKNSHLGIWSFMGATPSWAEFLIGPSWQVNINDVYAEFGIGGGVEQPSFTSRFGTSLFIKYSKIDFMAFGEYGEATGTWYFIDFMYNVSPLLGFGVHSQKFMGTGPEIKVTKGPFYLWTAPVWDNQINSWGTAIGMGLKF